MRKHVSYNLENRKGNYIRRKYKPYAEYYSHKTKKVPDASHEVVEMLSEHLSLSRQTQVLKEKQLFSKLHNYQ